MILSRRCFLSIAEQSDNISRASLLISKKKRCLIGSLCFPDIDQKIQSNWGRPVIFLRLRRPLYRHLFTTNLECHPLVYQTHSWNWRYQKSQKRGPRISRLKRLPPSAQTAALRRLHCGDEDQTATPFATPAACTLRPETSIVQQTYVGTTTRNLKMIVKAVQCRMAPALGTVTAMAQVDRRPVLAALLSTSIRLASRHWYVRIVARQQRRCGEGTSLATPFAMLAVYITNCTICIGPSVWSAASSKEEEE